MKKSELYREDVRAKVASGISRHNAIGLVAESSGVSPSTVDRAMRNRSKPKSKKDVEQVVGIIGDSHLPYEHKDYLQFCIDTFKSYGVNRVIHIGDLIDNHGLSFHDNEPSLLGSTGERNLVLDQLEPWFEAFPDLTLIQGNHDMMANRKAVKMGIDPTIYMRPLGDVYNFPKGWDIENQLVINGVMYHHGETALGLNGFRNDAQKRMMNTVTGHCHSNFGVSYTATDHRMVYGLAVGCGVDNDSMAFAYGKNFKQKPILGCGIVANNGKLPISVPMDLGEKW
tara:strand:+ start:4627 stop:5475 length:849 start_codon:yes stop_codon:yes gene_type:complete